MKRFSFIRLLLASCFAVTVLFTVSFHEVHYLLVQHHQHEDCDNHLHAADEHGHCSICKFDAPAFTDEIVFPASQASISYFEECFTEPKQVQLYKTTYANPLRGPPALA